MLPDLLNKIVANATIIIDQPIEREAILNAFMAKFCSVVASKQVTTDSSMHIEPTPLQYYALNLLPSGMGKNKLKGVVDQLFEWYEVDCEQANCRYFEQQKREIDARYKDAKSREKAYKEIMEYNCEINGASSQYVYEVAKWITDNNFGSLYFFNTEFAKMFVNKIDYNDILDLSLNGADGTIDYVSVMTHKRKTLEHKVSMSMYLATAYERLLDPIVHKDFIEFGNTGFFRRSFVYFLDNSKVVIRKPYTYNEKLTAKNEQRFYTKELQSIYNSINTNTQLVFSEEANALIRDYRMSVDDEIKQNFSYGEYLLPSDESYKINLINSPWKITKTAFLFHLLEEPSGKIVKTSSVNQAIEFFQMFNKFLFDFLHKRITTYRDYIISFVLKNLNKKMTKSAFLEDIRNLIYCELSYKEWFELKKDLLVYIKEDLLRENIYLCEEEDMIVVYQKNQDTNSSDLTSL